MEHQNTASVRKIYNRWASKYNLAVRLYPLIGWRMHHYRLWAVEALHLKKGDVVVDLCCGTGLNFPHIMEKIGPEGKLIGVDLSDAMLREAQKLVDEKGWKNVTLFNEDALKFAFPMDVNGIITSYAITLIPEYDEIIQRGAESLVPGGRFVVLDFKKPKFWPLWFTKLMLNFFIKPFGGELGMMHRHPWKSLEKYLRLAEMKAFYFGSTYVAVGEKEDL